MPIKKCYNMDCEHYTSTCYGLDVKNHCNHYKFVAKCPKVNLIKEKPMNKQETQKTIAALKAICLCNLAGVSASEKDVSLSPKDRAKVDAIEFGKIINELGACRGGAEATRKLVNKITGLNITTEMIRSASSGSGSASLGKLPHLMVYVPVAAGMEMQLGSPFMHLTGRKFLTMNMTIKDACYARGAGLKLASKAKVELLFKSLEIQVELGKSLSNVVTLLIKKRHEEDSSK